MRTLSSAAVPARRNQSSCLASAVRSAISVCESCCSWLQPLPLYHPRNPHTSDLWRLMDQHFQTFQQVYDERYHAKYGYWRPIVEQSVAASARRALAWGRQHTSCGVDAYFARIDLHFVLR